MRDFRKIEAWRLADDLTVAVYRESQKFPKDEIYGLTSQLRRAAYSDPANIAEGSSGESKRDYPHFLYIARGSLAETRYFLHLARRLGYLSTSAEATLEEQAGHVFGCLHGLIRSIEKESGKLTTITASITSFIALTLAGLGTKLLGP
ncbi:MAG TPA: four helix bundle protein [Opitutus sp.]|nr:four helix bundle protein [Opitutus sp.]